MTDSANSETALVLAPTGRDAVLACNILDEGGIACRVFDSIGTLIGHIARGGGFAVVAEEALQRADPRAIAGMLREQPEWSDFPFILMTAHGGSVERNPTAQRQIELLGNVTFLERPFHPTTLVSMARAALRGRRRQYEARSRIEAVREAERRLQLTLEAGRLGAWSIDLTTHELTTSGLAKMQFGRSPDEDMTLDTLVAAIHPDDRDHVWSEMQRAADGRGDYQVDYRCIWPDGSVHCIEARGRIDAPVTGRAPTMSGVTLDVTNSKRAQRALARSEERFRAAVNAVSGVVWTNAADGRMLGEQPGWATLTGQSREEYQGYGWASAVHPDDAEKSIETWNAAVAARAPYVFEHRVRRADGSWGHFAIRAIPALESDGSIREWVGVHTDITAQRLAERALSELNANLEERIAQATAERRRAEENLLQSQKLETIGQLTGGVAHDFNNLLTPILSSLEVLKAKLPGDPHAQRWASAGIQSAERASALVTRLLAFARRQSLDVRPVDLGELVRGTEDLLRRSIGSTVEVSVNAHGPLPLAIADANQVELAILNLCINARDAMSDGGTVSIDVDTVARGEYAFDEAVGPFIRVSVRDTGSGMSEETMRRAVEPFYTTKGVGEGTGLGLSMVNGLVGQLEGGMTIESELGQGTTVALYLPVADASATMSVAAPVEVFDTPAKTARILLVDDEMLIRFVSSEMLREAGYEVVEAASGAQALERVEEGFKPDVLITDQLMPGMKGSELAERLVALVPGLRVLVASGYSDVPNAPFARIAKPFAAADLIERVRQLVEEPVPASLPVEAA